MSRDWTQVRVRIPADLHAEVESAALAAGSTVQRELLMRIVRGSQTSPGPVAMGAVRGEIEVAEKLVSSLAAVVDQMKRQVETSAEPAESQADHGE